MQMRSLPFWLMIVSTATAVLPVWRSPMISSRWPRPIGTIASIDLRPVCTGWLTDLRAITPGATFSMTSNSFASIGPLPSIGWPSALTTRPISVGPTGTSRMRPVHLTVSPSEMCSYSPRITAPTESRSRLSARPKVFFGNSSISPCIASCRPWMRTMPSVTDTTRADAARFGRGREVLDACLDQFADLRSLDGHVANPLQACRNARRGPLNRFGRQPVVSSVRAARACPPASRR